MTWGETYSYRDLRIRAAYDFGFGINEITKASTLAKSTVIRILGSRIEAERARRKAAGRKR